jgi:D-glycero-D-manno-heptose 1,7-bisphosphate phosphatase
LKSGKTQMRRAVFLDRDGVINRSLVRDGKPYAPTHISEFELLPGVPAALSRLREHGFLNIVVTNQPDITTGKQRREDLDVLHAHLQKELAIDAFKVCCHVDADGCACRKPKPGLLHAAALEWSIDLGASYMVGDRWRDVAAGQRAGCRTCFFIDYDYAEKRPEQPFTVVKSLENSVQYILADTG